MYDILNFFAGMMKVALLGHSYVAHLRRSRTLWSSADEVRYFEYPGKSYSHFTTGRLNFDAVTTFNPEVIFVILGGNSIKIHSDALSLCREAHDFYAMLRQNFAAARIVSVQVELRFYDAGNRWLCPTPDVYRRKRRTLNKYISKIKYKDHILQIQGPGRIDDRRLYSTDGVHLNNEGWTVYSQLILSMLRYIKRI